MGLKSDFVKKEKCTQHVLYVAQFCTVLHSLHCLALSCTVYCTVFHALPFTLALSCINFAIFLHFAVLRTCVSNYLAWLAVSQYYPLCLALSFVVLNCLAQLTALYVEPSCTVFHCLALACTVLNRLALFQIALHSLTKSCPSWTFLAFLHCFLNGLITQLDCTALCFKLSCCFLYALSLCPLIWPPIWPSSPPSYNCIWEFFFIGSESFMKLRGYGYTWPRSSSILN